MAAEPAGDNPYPPVVPAPLLVGLRRWRFQDILLRPAEGEVVPGTTVTLSIAALVGGLDTLADRARHGGGRSWTSWLVGRWGGRGAGR